MAVAKGGDGGGNGELLLNGYKVYCARRVSCRGLLCNIVPTVNYTVLYIQKFVKKVDLRLNVITIIMIKISIFEMRQ